jgi:hypothetical protein
MHPEPVVQSKVSRELYDSMCKALDEISSKSTKRMLYIWRLEAILTSMLERGVTPSLREDAEHALGVGKKLNGSQ